MSPVPRITSRRNSQVARLRKLLASSTFRREEGAWVLEGEKLAREAAEEARAGGLRLRRALLSQDEEGRTELGDLPARLEALEVEMIPAAPEVVAWVSALESSRGIVLEVEPPDAGTSLEAVGRGREGGEGLWLLAAGVQDPGNLGALARVAEGAGARGVIRVPPTADPGNPKALRGSAGSLLRLACITLEAEEVAGRIEQAGLRLAAAVAEKEDSHIYTEVDWRGGWVLALGAEGKGLPSILREGAHRRVRIPTRRVESLNVATAAAVLLFEAIRQRSAAPPAD